MKKYLLSLAVVALFGIYLIVGRQSSVRPLAQNAPISGGSSTDSSASVPATTGSDAAVDVQTSPPATPVQPSGSQSVPAATSQAAGQYKDGTYTGQSVDSVYGYIQAQAVVSGGKLATVNMLEYPNDRAESQQISAMSLPKLVSEAIVAQSANVDIVSGATDTAHAFKQSLASALQQAIN